MPEALIAILDDETDILDLVSIHLQKSGFKAVCFSDPVEFFSFITRQVPHLLILDLMLPGMDGLDICKKLRSDEAISHIPIIMLTAKADETDRIIGLELGADDYVTKPFSPRELVARVKAVLRRQHAPASTSGQDIRIGDILHIDLARHRATLYGEPLQLTATEFKILEILASKEGWVFTRDQIIEQLWNNEKAVITRTVDVHVKHLREKLGQAGSMITSLRGVGYKLDRENLTL